MPEQILTLLKYVVLAILYLFFLRVLRAVWVELREPKAAPVSPPGPMSAAPMPAGPMSAGPMPAGAGPADSTVVNPPGGAAPGWHAPAGPAGRLVVTAPAEQRGKMFALGEEITVGRAPGCGIALADDTFVSQLHARVFRRDGDVWVEDLGSTNGTFINNRKVAAPTPLRRGDALKVGKTALELAP
ncbi:MAG: FHA domain-containing protein [Acidimicrobiales bacterium]